MNFYKGISIVTDIYGDATLSAIEIFEDTARRRMLSRAPSPEISLTHTPLRASLTCSSCFLPRVNAVGTCEKLQQICCRCGQ